MKNIALLLALCTIAFTACKKDEGDKNTAGKGGNATLKVTTKHHSQNIDSCMVYLRYNAKTGPLNNIGYDDSMMVVQENGQPIATFTNLKAGQYFLYGRGYDPFIAAEVVGGIPYQIKDENTQSLVLAVTESAGH